MPSKKEEVLRNGDILFSMFIYCQSEESMKVASLHLRTALVTGYSISVVCNSFSARPVTVKGR